jgi:hypothetical protein
MGYPLRYQYVYQTAPQLLGRVAKYMIQNRKKFWYAIRFYIYSLCIQNRSTLPARPGPRPREVMSIL